MTREITPLILISCLLISAASCMVVVGLLSTQDTMGLIIAVLTTIVSFSGCWWVLSLGKRPNVSESQNITRSGQRREKPRRDINARMGLTGAVLIAAFIAGMIWVRLNMFGTVQDLYLGWRWIGFVAVVAVCFTWLVKPKND